MATYDTSYYDKAYEEFEKKQKQSAQDQKTQTEADYNNRLKQAYIANRQTQKATDEALTRAGIRGGMTETSALKNSLAYQNTRNTLGAEKASAIREIDKNADNNIFAYKQTTDAAKNAYAEGREAEDREVARQQAENQKETNIQLMTTQYGAYNDVNELQDALSKTTDPNEQIIIQARINFLNEQNTAKQATNNIAYLESKYNGISNLDTLKAALNKAPTTEEKTIIQNRINAINEANNATKYDRYTALYSRYYNIDNLEKLYKQTTDKVVKQVINERIGYLKAQKKGY